MLGQALARRTLGGDTLAADLVGQIDEIQVAEALVTGTDLVNKTLAQTRLREQVGVSVLGTWERGQFPAARPDMMIHAGTVLVLAGSWTQMQRYNERFHRPHDASGPVLIIGGGRVARRPHVRRAWRGLSRHRPRPPPCPRP